MNDYLVTSLNRRARSGQGRERDHLESSVWRRVPENRNSRYGHLVPLMSEVRIQKLAPRPASPDTGRPTHSGVFEPCFFTQHQLSADSGFGGSMGDITEDTDSAYSTAECSVTIDASSVSLVPGSFSESVCIGSTSKEPLTSYISVYDVKVKPRCKNGVEFGNVLTPESYQSKLIVYRDSTRRKHKNVVFYRPKNRPVRFAETFYIRPRTNEQRFLSCVEIGGPATERKWYESTLHLIPVTNSCAQLASVEMNYNSDGEEDDGDSVFKEHLGMRRNADDVMYQNSLRASSRSTSYRAPQSRSSYSSSMFVRGRSEEPDINGYHEFDIQNGHISGFRNGHISEDEQSYA